MRLVKGADVYSAAGERIGTLSRVVVDPQTRKASHLVVEKGLLFTTNKLIPIDQVNQDNEEKIILNTAETDLESFTDFEEAHYVNLEDTDYPGTDVAASFWYPPVDYAWWRSGVSAAAYPPTPVYTMRTTQNIPDGTVALEEGARVVSADDKEVGNIEELIVETEDKRVTHFVVSAGFLFKERRLIPVTWIATIGEDRVRLSVNAGTLERLPAYQKAR